MHLTPQMIILFLMALLSIFLGISILRGRYRGHGVNAVAVMMFAGVFWMVGLGMEMGAEKISSKLFWDAIQYVGIAVIPGAWLIYNLQFSGRDHWVTPGNILLLAMIPVVFILLILSNPHHELMWSSTIPDPEDVFLELEKTFGPLYWGFLGISFLQVLVGALLPVEMLVRSGDIYRWQASAILIGVLVLICGVLLGVFKVGFFTRFDVGPITLGLMTWILGWVVLRLRLVDLQRVAREAVIEGMNHGVVILDSEDDVVYLNPVAEKLVDCNKEEAIGKAVEEIWEDWPIGMNPSKDAAEISKEVVVGEGNAIHAYEVRLSPLLDWRQRRAGGVLLMRDITERKQSEKALKRYAEELERSNQNLERFAYIASHDLQEPLRMVAGYTQLLARRYAGQLDQDADEFIAYAVDGASRMQELINDLLEYSRVGTRGNPFEPVETEQVIEQVFRNLQVAIEESQARITHDPLPRLMADKTQIIQLFQNLIGNAIKFRGNGALKIHVRAEEKQEDWHFAVCDNGIGIAPKYQKRIFQIFQRLHGRDEYEGTGIGLAVCKRIVERHGGRIWVESEPGEGSVFHFSMPKDARSLS